MCSIRVCIALVVSLFYCGVNITATAQDASNPIHVEEDKLHFRLFPRTVLELPIVNSTQKPISGKFSLWLLNPDDDSIAAAKSGTFNEMPGETIESVEWPAE